MARRTKSEAQETRQAILDAAVEVFHERGVARTSLTEVAELAGLSRGAVYVHFRDKADLVSALCERIRFPADALSGASLEDMRLDPLGELQQRWLELFQEVARNEEWQLIFAIVFHRIELVTESGAIHDRVLEGHHLAKARTQQLLELAIASGQVPANLDVTMATALLHGSLVGVLQDWLLAPAIYDLPAMAERVVTAIFGMLDLPFLSACSQRSSD